MGAVFVQSSVMSTEVSSSGKLVRELIALLKGWALSFAGWGTVAFVLGAKAVLESGGPWTMTIGPSIRDWLPWAVLTPLLFRFVTHFPLDRETWKTRVPLHLICCVVVIALCQRWQGFYDPSFRPARMPPPPPPFAHGEAGEREREELERREHEEHERRESPEQERREHEHDEGPPFAPPHDGDEHHHHGPRRGPSRGWVDLFHLVTFGLPIYLMIVSGAHAVVFFRREQQRAASLAEARLDSLRSQLQPHFLFNTLNVIAELVHQDAEKADAMITALSEMLRLTLDTKAEQLVPLSREIEFIEQYFSIMQIRLGDRLRYEVSITPMALDGLVPPFILQPLVENAILHGIERVPGGGLVKISGQIEGDKLRLTIADDGAGMQEPLTREGIGLSNTRARLQQLFAGEVTVKLTNGKGVTVDVTIPFRRDDRTSRPDR